MSRNPNLEKMNPPDIQQCLCVADQRPTAIKLAQYFKLLVPSFLSGLKFLIIVALMSLPVSTEAQRKRPKILPRQFQQFVGRILLIPRDDRPVSWKLPRQIARIADHEIIYPPRDVLGNESRVDDAHGIINWAKKLDHRQLNGVVVSLDRLFEDANNEQVKENLAYLNWIRQQHPNLPIYGFVNKVYDEISKIVFDDLLIDPDNENLGYLSVARFLNRYYQRPLKVASIASTEYSLSLATAINQQLQGVGAQMAAVGKGDIFLFLHMPDTDEEKLNNFIEALVKTISAGYYVALADLSDEPDRLIAALRERKQLDFLQSYAASSDPKDAVGKVLAQCSARIVAAKVLRTGLDLDQLQRAERAQVELLISRYIEDWGYEIKVRPKLESFIINELKGDPENLGAMAMKDDAERFLNAQLREVAHELFASQFKFNKHSVKMLEGTKADFRLEFLQLFRARFAASHTDEIDIDLSIHLPLLVDLGSYGIIRR